MDCYQLLMGEYDCFVVVDAPFTIADTNTTCGQPGDLLLNIDGGGSATIAVIPMPDPTDCSIVATTETVVAGIDDVCGSNTANITD